MTNEETQIPMSAYMPTGNNPPAQTEAPAEGDDLEGQLAELQAMEAELDATSPAPESPPPISGIAMVGGQFGRASMPTYDPLAAAAALSESVKEQADTAPPEIDEWPAPPEGNIAAAMEKVAETMDHNVSTKVSDDDGPADKQILIRSTQRDHERWKLAAEREGKSMSAFVRQLVNAAVADVLDCSHPEEFRQRYPWSETCMKCHTRLWQSNETHIENRR